MDCQVQGNCLTELHISKPELGLPKPMVKRGQLKDRLHAVNKFGNLQNEVRNMQCALCNVHYAMSNALLCTHQTVPSH